jgi:hypothetical protein
MELVPGRYEVVVERQGYKTARHWVTISTQDVTLNVALVPDRAAPVAPPPSGVTTSPPRIALQQDSIPEKVENAQSRVIVIGKATGDGVAEVAVNGKKAELGADGTFAAETVLKVGENTIHVTALNIYGKVGEKTFTITRQSAQLAASLPPRTSPPTESTIEILSPEGLRVGARETRIALRGRVTAPDGVAEVTVNGQAAALESDGAFIVGVTLEAGDTPLVVAAVDTQGQVTEQTFTLSRPIAPGVTPVPDSATGESSPQQPASTPTITLQRYLTMEAPEEVIPDQEFAVQVAFTMEQRTPEVKVVSGTTTPEGQLVLSLPAQPAQESWTIDVVMATPDFTFRAGTNTSTLVLPRQGDSTPAVFYLRAKPVQGIRQARHVYVTLWYRGAFLGKVTRQITVVAPKRGKRAASAASSSAVARASGLPPRPPGQAIALTLGGQSPDLTVFLLDKAGIMLLQSPHLQLAQEAFSMPKILAEWLQTQYARFAQEAPRGLVKPDPDATASRSQRDKRLALLRGVGRELYQKFAPPSFKDAFWHLRDKLGARFQSIQIYTSNPLLPWELMRPMRADGTEEQDFLGVEFRIARWHIPQGTPHLERPPLALPLQELAVIAPHYTGALFLPNQESEIQALQHVTGYRRVPGQFALVQDLFMHVPTGIVHFSGHGVVREKRTGIFEYAIRLEDIELDLLTWRGLAAQHPQGHPFIFFNACDIGQAHRVANFVSGWAPAVLEAGASGYIGGLWPLGDTGAATFAAYFYQLMQHGLATGPVTVAEVVREARRLFYRDGDPTFLAYVYYGDPAFQFIPRP